MKNFTTFIIFLLIIYILYQLNILKNSMKENMTNTSNVDHEAIKNLSEIAKSLMKGGLRIPGNLTVDGNLQAKNLNVKNDLGNVNIKPDKRSWAHISYEKNKVIYKNFVNANGYYMTFK